MKSINAKKGLKKVFISQVFAIIMAMLSSCTMLFIGMFKVLSVDSETVSSLFELAVLSITFSASMLLTAVFSYIFGIIGYYQAGKVEAEFKKSMLCMIASGALVIIGNFFQIPNGTLYTILTSAGSIVESVEMSERGDRLLKILVAIYIISAIDTLIIRIFELSAQAKIVSFIIDVIDLALIVLRYVLYMRYLHGAMKMLAENNADVLRS